MNGPAPITAMRTQTGLDGYSHGSPVVSSLPTSAIPATLT